MNSTARSTGPGMNSSSELSHATISPVARSKPLFMACVWPRSGSETQMSAGSPRASRIATVSSVEPPSMTMCSCGTVSAATLSSVCAM